LKICKIITNYAYSEHFSKKLDVCERRGYTCLQLYSKKRQAATALRGIVPLGVFVFGGAASNLRADRIFTKIEAATKNASATRNRARAGRPRKRCKGMEE
jgi:hypothetical protein